MLGPVEMRSVDSSRGAVAQGTLPGDASRRHASLSARAAAADCAGSAPDERISSSPTPNGSGGKPTILVADDNADVVACLAMLLEMKGWTVIKAYDGPQAVAAAEREQPDVVLLDIGMPGLDGHAACRRIRALPAGRRPRIIALSGWGLDSDCRLSTEAGFDGHLVKPVASADLLRALHGV